MTTWIAAMRWSYSTRAWCGLFQLIGEDRAHLRHEMTWVRHTPEEAAPEMLARLSALGIVPIYLVLNHECFPDERDAGETISETWQRATGLSIRCGHHDRIAGWSRFRSWLQPPSPRLTVHPDCKYFIRTVPTLISNKTQPDDVDETPTEYPAMGAAMFCMSRPMPVRELVDDSPKIGTWGHELRHVLHPSTRRVLGGDLVQRS